MRIYELNTYVYIYVSVERKNGMEQTPKNGVYLMEQETHVSPAAPKEECSKNINTHTFWLNSERERERIQRFVIRRLRERIMYVFQQGSKQRLKLVVCAYYY